MAEYRTPDEEQAAIEQSRRVRAVLEQAVHDGASCMAAMDLGEPQDVVELWIDRVWDGLREGLVDEPTGGNCNGDRLAAIVLLLQTRMRAGADMALREVREAGR